MPYSEPSEQNSYLETHVALLLYSFRRVTGHDLISCSATDNSTGKTLYYAPFAVVSHDTAEDPIFNYANQVALDLFEMTWQEFITLPSRKSAEPQNQAERVKLLESVSVTGFVNNYSGIRISKTGRRFLINDTIIWNVIDETGRYHGQAATFACWIYL